MKNYLNNYQKLKSSHIHRECSFMWINETHKDTVMKIQLMMIYRHLNNWWCVHNNTCHILRSDKVTYRYDVNMLNCISTKGKNEKESILIILHNTNQRYENIININVNRVYTVYFIYIRFVRIRWCNQSKSILLVLIRMQ